jgi:hypothetical protein
MTEETLEEAAEKYIAEDNNNRYYNDFIAGAKWQQERMYSEEEVYNLLCQFPNEEELDNWFEQNKKK